MTITGNRFKRSEGDLKIFKNSYMNFHKLLTFIFTGKLIKFGNFLAVFPNIMSQVN